MGGGDWWLLIAIAVGFLIHKSILGFVCSSRRNPACPGLGRLDLVAIHVNSTRWITLVTRSRNFKENVDGNFYVN